MNEEIEFILDTAKEAMNNAIEHLEKAIISCNKIVDKELKAEIHDLLEKLKES